MLNKKGFTLIEVVVVTLIIAALALLFGPSFKNSALTNQMEKAKIGLVELTTAVKLYNEVHTTPLTGDLDETMFNTLTQDTTQGYVYLQDAGRWEQRSGATEYSLRDGGSVLNCRYTVGNTANAAILASVKCQFNKVDQEGTECYLFFIEKTNPAVIKKESTEVNCDDL